MSPSEVHASQSLAASEFARRAIALLSPTACGANLLRVGGEGDGGYVVADLEYVGAVSAGTGAEVEFDWAMASRGSRVLQIDNVRPAALRQSDRVVFEQATVGTSLQATLDARRLESADELLSLWQSHFGDRTGNMLLKMDIEGSEWSCLAASRQMAAWSMIVLEFHGLWRLAEESHARLMLSVLELLTETHTPVFTHGNNCCGFSVIGGVPIPNIIEVSWLRRSLAGEPVSGPDVPTQQSLASPNLAGLADLWLWGLRGSF